jgi:hypothetical protein
MTFILGTPLSLDEMLDKLIVVLVICALLMAVYVVFAYVGKRRIEKNMS